MTGRLSGRGTARLAHDQRLEFDGGDRDVQSHAEPDRAPQWGAPGAPQNPKSRAKLGAVTAGASRLYWSCWILATATTGLVAGFFLGHALLLGRFLDWQLMSGRAGVLASTYPVFREGPGRGGLDVFYAIAGIQVLAGLAFAAVSIIERRRPVLGLFVGAAGIAWPIVHYATGFAATEARVLRSTVEASRDVAVAFVSANGPVHVFHVVALGVAFLALLSAPLTPESKRP